MEQIIGALLGALVGALLTAIAGFIFARKNAKKVAQWLSKMIVKATMGDITRADEIEDKAGDWLIEVGKELKAMHRIGNEGGERNF